MTSNQIAYWTLQEQKRSNAEKEQETKRANLAKEGETARHNVTSEVETERANRASEKIDKRGQNFNLITGVLRNAHNYLVTRKDVLKLIPSVFK